MSGLRVTVTSCRTIAAGREISIFSMTTIMSECFFISLVAVTLVTTLFLFYCIFPLTCVGVGVFWNLVSDLVDVTPIYTLNLDVWSCLRRCIYPTLYFIFLFHISDRYFSSVWIAMDFCIHSLNRVCRRKLGIFVT